MQQINMKSRQLFPLGKAYGDAFCNRVLETQKLIGNIESGKHTFLFAPRRYGKSSLCEKAFEKITISHLILDFHLAVTGKDAERILVKGINDLIWQSIGSIEKLSHVVKQYAKRLKPKLGIGSEHFRLELEIVDQNNIYENISEAFLILEKLLKEKNKNAVLLLDEFQEIGMMDEGRGIEGAIRHVAQETQYLALIFSGSSPHLMKNMFEDERRPLYKLCRKLVLERMHASDYQTHLNKASEMMWHCPLSDIVFQKIMTLTECHPYYVNYLCDELWSQCQSCPTKDEVIEAWHRTVDEERSDLLKDFFTLSDNQRRVMIYLANEGGSNIYAMDAAKIMDMPVSSISRAMATLIEKDFVEKVDDQYQLIVPAYKILLSKV